MDVQRQGDVRLLVDEGDGERGEIPDVEEVRDREGPVTVAQIDDAETGPCIDDDVVAPIVIEIGDRHPPAARGGPEV